LLIKTSFWVLSALKLVPYILIILFPSVRPCWG
jgi:hypothetical protein